MISQDDVKKLAALARIKLTEKEEEKFAKEIDGIVGYVAHIQKFTAGENTQGQEKVKNVLREDKNPHESGIHTETILAEAPQREGNYVKVKKIL